MTQHTRVDRPNAETAPKRKSHWLTTLLFAAVILIPSGFGFSRKFMELLALTRGDADGAFAITPVVNYLLSSLGFFFLFCWAILNGMFGDIEQPKRTMLETERMLDGETLPAGRGA
jgi:hypothetical protein